ncbi:MAG: helix-hairpin-helix domain-containing protein, partial [Solirubrobacterales bacterium]
VARPTAPLAAPKPLPPEPEPVPFEQLVAAQPTAPDAAAAAQPDPEPAPEVRGRESDQSVAPAGSDLAPEAGPPEPPGEGQPTPITTAAGGSSSGGPVSLNRASFEQLRDAGMSVTQTGRVLAYRERSGGFSSVDELNSIPGFPKDFLDVIRDRIEP